MLNLKNHFIMALLKLGYSGKDGKITQRHIDFYLRRANHVGAVTLEPLYMDKNLRELPTQIGIDNSDKLDGLMELTSLIHQKGAKVIAHLNHPGRMANPMIPNNYFVSSSAKACPAGGKIPKKMTKDDIEYAISLFVDSAKRAEEAGFDIIELQFGHGHLVAQFMSAEVNDRKDEYGETFENRIRFGLEILNAVKKAVSLPVIIRLSGDEMTPNGIKLDEVKKFAIELEKNGADALHIIAGSLCSTPPWFFQHMFVPKGKTWEFAKEIKNIVKFPIIFVGQINTFEDIKKLESEYSADYIAVGRALVSDPDFIGKYIDNTTDVYKPCMACSDGCLGGVKSGKGLGCVVNPMVGKYDSYEFEQADTSKKYAVIGGGLAGMEAAIDLFKKGHSVDLYEKDDLGGQFNLAYLPPKKQSLQKIVDYYKQTLKNSSVNIIKKDADENDILNGNYNGAIIATGSQAIIPPIEGLSEYHWAEVLLPENNITNKKVLIIGGGLIGIEVAHKLLKNGNEVIVVEMMDEIARGMEIIEKKMTLMAFKKENIKIYTNTKAVKIDSDKVTLEGEFSGIVENIDEIVIATGMKSYNELENKLKGKLPTYVIGDAQKVAKAQDAIREAFETVKNM